MSEENQKKDFDPCRDCPVARIVEKADFLLQPVSKMDCSDFSLHMARARKEVFSAIRSLLDEMIKQDDDWIEKKESKKKSEDADDDSGKKRRGISRIDID